MCGIVGIAAAGPIDRTMLRRMSDRLVHRGPDGDGVAIEEDARIGFAHRRLAIVDLSTAGAQPMRSRDGRWLIVFNGEIYNHLALRGVLEGERRSAGAAAGAWRGHSDTETLLACVAAWGVRRAVEASVGMFAFALWDCRDHVLHLVRDRFGEKPLFYGRVGDDFAFASELKALRAHPGFDNPVDRGSLREFIARGYVGAPRSIHERIFKLEPGCILSLPRASLARRRSTPPEEAGGTHGERLIRYWSYGEAMLAGLANPIADARESAERLEAVLGEAIRGQMIADVPVGAFLSGGIDSSSVVALYQRHASRPVRTFSIGFAEAGFDEARYAKAVAEALGTVHQEHYVTARDALDVVPRLAHIYDEPFGDSSQLPTYLVSAFAKASVAVALSGDGGDELFAGYNRHFSAPRLWHRLQAMPRALYAPPARLLGLLPAAWWERAAALAGRRRPRIGGKLQKMFRIAGRARSFDEVYRSFLDEWDGEDSPVVAAHASTASASLVLDDRSQAADTLRVMYQDAVSYLPDDILCKVDRAAMAVSLETRVPFLDHRVAELAARIPLAHKIRAGQGKAVLRDVLFAHAPRALFERPKAGFAVPVGEWLRGPLRDWAEDLLNPAAMAAAGYLDPRPVARRWRDHLSGRRDSTSAIWNVLMFEAWRRAWA